MIQIGDQVELTSPVEPYRIARAISSLAPITGEKIGEDQAWLYYDRSPALVGAVGIVIGIIAGRALVHWTHYLPASKPPGKSYLISSLELLYRPEYPQPEGFHGKDTLGVWPNAQG